MQLRPSSKFSDITLLISSVLLSLAGSASAQPAEETRKLWAYPRGVIVTTTVPALSRIKDETLREELEALAGRIEPEFAACLADLRDRRAELRGGPRVSLGLSIKFFTDGRIDTISPERVPPPELVECTARSMVAAQNYKISPLPPTSKPKPVTVRIVLDGVILTDEEAKGKGFLFYEAETRWERELRAHPEWVRCASDSQCATLIDRCEVHAVNTKHIDAFRDALGGRQERTCNDEANGKARAVCVKSRCTLRR